jgi:hypothetical protein
MRKVHICTAVFGILVAAVSAHPASPRRVSFQRVVIDREFRSEGAAIGDINGDGRKDIVAGNLWYEAPSWTPHEIAPVQKFDGAAGYSNSFFNWCWDVNGDGWVDQILIPIPGDRAVWRENPKGAAGPWKEHVIWNSACNESPAFLPLQRGGKPVLVFPHDEKYMAWYAPKAGSAGAEFEAHRISNGSQPGVQRFYHGLGVGDINGDGRPDIVIPDGWYEQPPDLSAPSWTFHPTKLGPNCAQMWVADFNRDGLPDVISSSSHGVGVWWYENLGPRENPTFRPHIIDESFSQSHAMAMADINGDGRPDFVTGKRFWAHGPKGDTDPSAPCVLVWYESGWEKGRVTWTRHTIDEAADSGVGTQITVGDVDGDGLADVLSANKKGVHLFLQRRR